MKKITFELQIPCTVGWDDDHDVATLEVYSFEDVLQVSSVLKEFPKTRFQSKEDKKEIVEAYKEIKDSLRTSSGEEVVYVGEVTGIKCLYKDDKGIQVEMSISDEYGVDGSARVDNAEYENEYKRLLEQSKKLATKILKL